MRFPNWLTIDVAFEPKLKQQKRNDIQFNHTGWDDVMLPASGCCPSTPAICTPIWRVFPTHRPTCRRRRDAIPHSDTCSPPDRKPLPVRTTTQWKRLGFNRLRWRVTDLDDFRKIFAAHVVVRLEKDFAESALSDRIVLGVELVEPMKSISILARDDVIKRVIVNRVTQGLPLTAWTSSMSTVRS